MERDEQRAGDYGSDHRLHGMPGRRSEIAYCNDMCAIRKCVRAKGFDTCGDCPELEHCPTVGAIFQHAPIAKENLLSPATI